MTAGPDRPAAGPLAGLLVADFSRILAGPYATMLLADLGAEVVKVEGPGGDDTRTWQPPVRDGVSTYYLGVNRNKRSVALDLKDAGDAALAQELARRADVAGRELQARRPGPVRPGLRLRRARRTPASSTPRSAASAAAPGGAALPGYDLIVQAISGLMSLTGDPDGEPYRAGISVFDVMAGLHATIGVLAALQPPARDRRGPARRGQPAVLGAVRAGQPDQRVRRRRRRPVPDGQQPPEPVPLRAAAVRRRRADRHRRQRRAVPQAVRGARRPGAGRRPALRAATRTAPPTATSCGRCWSSGCAPGTKLEWFRDIIAAGVPCGPINTIDQGVAFAEEVGLDPVVTVGEGAAARAVGAQPDHASPRRRRTTGCRRRRSTSTATRSGRWLARPGRSDGVSEPELPDLAGRLQPRRDHAARARTWPRDVMGKVGFGELAFWLATQRRPDARRDPGVRGGAGRAGRPRLHPDRDRHPADLPVGARLGAGRAGRRAARRRLPVPRRDRGLRPVPARRARRRGRRRCPTDDAGWDALALEAVTAPARGRRGSSPASATTCTRTATRAPRGCSRSPPRRGCSARTCRCSPRSAGCTRRCSGRTLPLNGAGVCGAALADLGLPLELLRGFALLARTAGLIGQLAEELRHPVGQRHLPVRRPEQRGPSPPDPYDPPEPPGGRHG